MCQNLKTDQPLMFMVASAVSVIGAYRMLAAIDFNY